MLIYGDIQDFQTKGTHAFYIKLLYKKLAWTIYNSESYKTMFKFIIWEE